MEAPLKTKFLRHSNNPFMTKELRKVIMKRSQLKDRYNKNYNYENWHFYKKQSDFCVSILRKTKRNYFKNVKMQDITGNKNSGKQSDLILVIRDTTKLKKQLSKKILL